jgi:predicted transposase YdaD
VQTIRSHDALFRFVFGEPEQMADLLRRSLPAALAAAIDWASLRAVDGTFVDAELRERQSDLLFAARLRTGEDALVYVVCEHKSGQDRFACWQLARYVIGVLERWRRDHPRALVLPNVIPFLVHHGDRAWHMPRSPHELVDLSRFEEPARSFLARCQLQLRFHLFDLAAMGEDEVEAMRLSAIADLTLRFLQFLRQRPPLEAAAAIHRWRHLVAQLLDHPRGREVLAALFSWWLASAPADPRTLHTVMTKIREENPPMRSLLDLLLEEGERRGEQKGMQLGMDQGHLAGQRALLVAQLQERFGAVSAESLARLAAADSAQLQRWGRQLLTADTVDDVFHG